MEQLREWFPVILSLISIVGGYFTLKAKVDEVTIKFAEFLENEYAEHKHKQEKYVQEHYGRIMALELKYASYEASQSEINKQLREQYTDIKKELNDIKRLISQGQGH